MREIAVAALSARMLAEAARGDGFEAVALDLFGDADTRRASTRWLSIGEPAQLRIEAGRLLPALASLAREGRVEGWIAGSGFEGCCEVLEAGAALLPLIGTPAPAVRRVRDARVFFGFLDAQGIAHPPVRWEAPDDPDGWLAKDAQGCGGWHIRRAADARDAPGAHHYFQREVSGIPMSATFIANGREAVVLGFNQQLVRPVAGQPFVFCGVLGPVAVAAGVRAQAVAALRAAVPAFGLHGLGSLDFMLADEALQVLEVNPRPPASLALYPAGTLAAHVRACVDAVLPPWPAQELPVRGIEYVFAPRAIRLDEAAASRLRARAGCHDLPGGAMHCPTGAPLCSVSAGGTNAPQVRQALERARRSLLQSVERAA